jgi:hypothetical protein
MNEQIDNLERGRQEIWRRQKLMIASVFLFLPYGIFILIPTSHYIGPWALPILIAIFLLGVFRIHKWFCTSPCPNCGNPLFSPFTKSAVHGRSCIHCKVDLRPTEKRDHKISFTSISYEPGNEMGDYTNQPL